MNSVSAALASHLVVEATTLATCPRIIRRDGVVLGFTDPTTDLEIDGVVDQALPPARAFDAGRRASWSSRRDGWRGGT